MKTYTRHQLVKNIAWSAPILTAACAAPAAVASTTSCEILNAGGETVTATLISGNDYKWDSSTTRTLKLQAADGSGTPIASKPVQAMLTCSAYATTGTVFPKTCSGVINGIAIDSNLPVTFNTNPNGTINITESTWEIDDANASGGGSWNLTFYTSQINECQSTLGSNVWASTITSHQSPSNVTFSAPTLGTPTCQAAGTDSWNCTMDNTWTINYSGNPAGGIYVRALKAENYVGPGVFSTLPASGSSFTSTLHWSQDHTNGGAVPNLETAGSAQALYQPYTFK